ncbi:MAG: efflux RND transporter periplasmic adaptor subunit [Bryobacter sp.]|nr:efflux RND transporter periplasmic adaptor subunit [Bryobacter sp.]
MLLKYGMPALAVVALTISLLSVRRMTPPVVHADPLSPPPKAAFAQQIGAVGLVESSTENIAVNLPVPGLVTRVAVKAGDTVQKGQLLFSLDDRDLRAELALRQSNYELAKTRLERLEQSPRPEEIPPAEAKVAEAQAQLEDARVQLRVLEAVKDPRAIRQEDLLRRRRAVESAEARRREAQANLALLKAGAWKADLEVARAELRQAEAQIRRIEADLARLHVTAPLAGQILQCKVRPGEYAQAGVLAQPLILLGQVEQMNIRADVDEKDAWRFRPGAKAIGSVRGNADQKFNLSFVRVEPYVVPKRNLTGDATERVDTRVLQIIYALPAKAKVYVGQQMDLSIEAANEAAK